MAPEDGSDCFGQRERDVEHPLERLYGDALAGLVVSFGPFARFTTGRPRATSAFASEAPPLATRTGSCPQSRSARSAARTTGRPGASR